MRATRQHFGGIRRISFRSRSAFRIGPTSSRKHSFRWNAMHRHGAIFPAASGIAAWRGRDHRRPCLGAAREAHARQDRAGAERRPDRRREYLRTLPCRAAVGRCDARPRAKALRCRRARHISSNFPTVPATGSQSTAVASSFRPSHDAAFRLAAGPANLLRHLALAIAGRPGADCDPRGRRGGRACDAANCCAQR